MDCSCDLRRGYRDRNRNKLPCSTIMTDNLLKRKTKKKTKKTAERAYTSKDNNFGHFSTQLFCNHFLKTRPETCVLELFYFDDCNSLEKNTAVHIMEQELEQ